MNTPLLTVCAWCDTVLANYSGIKGNLFVQRFKGSPLSKSDQASAILQGHHISHGMCESCRIEELERARTELRKRQEEKRKANANL